MRLEQPLQLKLTSSELMACGSWAEQIRAWGWELVVDNLAGRADVARIPVVLGKHLTTNDLQVSRPHGLSASTRPVVSYDSTIFPGQRVFVHVSEALAAVQYCAQVYVRYCVMSAPNKG